MPRGNGMGRKPRGRVGRGGGVGLGRPQMGNRPGVGPAQRVGGRGRASASQGGGIGRQLQSRVQSGAITQEQAQRTAQQRQTLQKAFGPDWRTKVFGATGAVKSARKGLAKHPDSARFQGLNKALLDRRRQLLEQAKKKLA